MVISVTNVPSGPPELEVLRRVDALRQHGHTSQAVGEMIKNYEDRYGDLGDHLMNLDYVSMDTAYIYQPQADGTFEPCLHNVLEGSLATALERGFIFAAPDKVEKQDTKNVQSGRGNSYDSGYIPIQPKRPYKCDECGVSYSKQSRLKNHINEKHEVK
tara:strand:+ start:752 stop:1225 length:474 start_codon:yes stop_codon:yes gene_type:complete